MSPASPSGSSPAIAEADLPVGVGRYNEDRVLYRHSPLFDGETREAQRPPRHRSLRHGRHRGHDAACRPTSTRWPTTPVSATTAPRSFWSTNSTGSGSGPSTATSAATRWSGSRWARPSSAGEEFAVVGDLTENGSWPPHLHFQIMADLMGHSGRLPRCRRAVRASSAGSRSAPTRISSSASRSSQTTKGRPDRR